MDPTIPAALALFAWSTAQAQPPAEPTPPPATGVAAAPAAPPVRGDCPADWTPSLSGSYTLTSYPGQDAVGPDGERPMAMSQDYLFASATYTMSGYPPLEVSGSYAVVEAEETRLQVRFFETIFDGSPLADQTKWLTFSRCGDTFEMDQMTYQRTAMTEARAIALARAELTKAGWKLEGYTRSLTEDAKAWTITWTGAQPTAPGDEAAVIVQKADGASQVMFGE